jgi:hypothetical protein
MLNKFVVIVKTFLNELLLMLNVIKALLGQHVLILELCQLISDSSNLFVNNQVLFYLQILKISHMSTLDLFNLQVLQLLETNLFTKGFGLLLLNLLFQIIDFTLVHSVLFDIV